MTVLYVSDAVQLQSRPDVDDQRNLSLDSGGVDPYRPALRVRAPDRLRPALLLVRHALRLPRRPEDEHRGRRVGRGGVRVPGRGDHRWGATSSARRLSTHERTARARPYGPARDRRPSQRRAGAIGGRPHHRREMPGERRGSEERLVESRLVDRDRRGQVRRSGSTGLRVRQETSSRATPSRAAAPRF